jgi:hypothetical protein
VHLRPNIDGRIRSLLDKVASIEGNLDMATALHEVWKPAAYDDDLHRRMGISLASQAFLVVRNALRREMLMALMRVWDRAHSAQSMAAVVKAIHDQDTWNAIVAHRRSGCGFAFLEDHLVGDLERMRDTVQAIHDKYAKGGPAHSTLKALIQLRNNHLAHTQVLSAAEAPRGPEDDQVEEFYFETTKAGSALLRLLRGQAHDYAGTANVYCHYARRFWAAARGENTDGHPDYQGDRAPWMIGRGPRR